MSDYDCDCCFHRHAMFTFAGGGQLVIDGTDGRAWFPRVQDSERYRSTWVSGYCVEPYESEVRLHEFHPVTHRIDTFLAVRLDVCDEIWEPFLTTQEVW